MQAVFTSAKPFEAFVWLMQYDRHGLFVDGTHHVIRLGSEERIQLPITLFARASGFARLLSQSFPAPRRQIPAKNAIGVSGTLNQVESLTGSANAVKGTRQRYSGDISHSRFTSRHQRLSSLRILVMGWRWFGIGGNPHRTIASSQPPLS